MITEAALRVAVGNLRHDLWVELVAIKKQLADIQATLRGKRMNDAGITS